MKLYLRPMSALDALSVVALASAEELDQAGDLGCGQGEQLALAIHSMDLGWTVARCADHGPVAVGGFGRMRDGVYRSFFLPVECAFADHGRELSVICARAIQNLLKDGAHRVETVSLSNRAAARAWYERIGLTFESESPGYSVTGKSAVTYVRIR